MLVVDATTETLLKHKNDISKITIKEHNDNCTITLDSQGETIKFIVGNRWVKHLENSQTLITYDVMDLNFQAWEIKILHEPEQLNNQEFALYFQPQGADTYIIYKAKSPIYIQ